MPCIISQLYRAFLNIKNILQQHCYLLKIDPTLEETFQQIPKPKGHHRW